MSDTKPAETQPAETQPAPAAEAPPTETEPLPAAAPAEEAAAAEPQADEATTDTATAPSAPAAGTSGGPVWPDTPPEHPISELLAKLPETLGAAGYNEVYGITLDTAGPFHTKLILQKFLRANANDVAKANDQLLSTLKWRKEFKPLEAKDAAFPKDKFGGLGYVTMLEDVPRSSGKSDVCTFNIYGAVKNNEKTFGEIDEFLRWRVALMELGIEKLGLTSATKPIPDFGQGPDPYQGIQVHDYMSVSFLRQDPYVKAASKKTIEVFGAYYPETLSRKFFVSVPLIMQWMFTAMKLFVSKETVKKFTVMSYANQLAGELGPSVPETYGGKAESLEAIGQTVKMQE